MVAQDFVNIALPLCWTRLRLRYEGRERVSDGSSTTWIDDIEAIAASAAGSGWRYTR